MELFQVAWDFDDFRFLHHLDPGLYLLCLGGLVAEALDELFCLLHLLLLSLCSLFQGFNLLLSGFSVFGVVAYISGKSAVE